MANFVFSAFADEAGSSLDEQIAALVAEQIKKIATYGYWGTNANVYDENGNVVYLTDDDGNYIYETDKDGNTVYEIDENGNSVPVKIIKTDASVRGSVASLVEMVKNHYSKEGMETTITVTYPDGTTKSEDILKVIEGLTESEALAITQAAIWTYSNNDDAEYWKSAKYGEIFVDDKLSVVGVLSALKVHNGTDPNPSWLMEYVPQKDIDSDVRLQVLYELFLDIQAEDVAHIELPEEICTSV